MKWSYKLGEWFGIDVRVHVTFLWLLAWLGFSAFVETRSTALMLTSVAFTVAVFCLVVLHEYGHALMARHFGIRTRHITLYPIGGVAALEGMPERPREQLLVALAGPAVNFVLALAAFALMRAFELPFVPRADMGLDAAALLSDLLVANVLMGSFNMLPALPMDGGRVLRALLAMRFDARTATRIAARVAKVVAVLMGIYALTHGATMLALIALVVWLGSSAESRGESGTPRAPTVGRDGRLQFPTQVLSHSRPEQRAEGATRVVVDGTLIELVQTPEGPRVRYTRPR